MATDSHTASDMDLPEAARSHEEPESGGDPIFSRFIDDEIYRPLLIEFAADLSGHVEEIEAVIGNQNLTEACRLCHRLKGAAATYGYPQLAEVAGAMENMTSLAEPGQSQVSKDLYRLVQTLRGIAERIRLGTRLRSAAMPLQ